MTGNSELHNDIKNGSTKQQTKHHNKLYDKQCDEAILTTVLKPYKYPLINVTRKVKEKRHEAIFVGVAFILKIPQTGS